MTCRTVAMGRGSSPRGAFAGAPRRARRAVVLLEVVLATSLFFMGSLIILSGLNVSLRMAQRVQTAAQAADLAVTLLSEIQMALVPLVSDGPNAFEDEDLAGWTWQIVADPAAQDVLLLDLPEVIRVEVVVRHEPTGFVYRLVELVSSDEALAPSDMPPVEGADEGL